MAKVKREYEGHSALPMILEAPLIAHVIENKARELSDAPSFGSIRTALAIDPGTANCAVALIRFNPDGTEERVFTSKLEPPKDFTSKPYLQCLYLQRILEQIIQEHVPHIVFKEGPSHNSPFKAHDLGRAHQAIENACWNTGRTVVPVAPQTMRAFVGSRAKDETRQLIFKKFKREFPTSDEADAYGIAKTGMALLSGEYKTGKTLAKEKLAAKKTIASVKKAVAKKTPTRKKSVRKVTRKKTRR